MLHFQIDTSSGVPVYRQLMDQIRYYIASGALKEGDKLPSIRALAKQLTVNPTTIVKTFSELEHEGVIEMKQGKGAFVAVMETQMSAEERSEALRPAARQLAVEASQMGALEDELLKLVREEFKNIKGKENV